jgi:hypothetical protein
VTTYDVLRSSVVLFTTETLGLAGGAGAYEASDEDFVKETDEGAQA